ncbi:capsular exopolysaccharide family [Paramicrobacterium humi]|uniref:Capsular exopolysaccharide family n=2 Tax=Paramicrobacterium humi TaxID=640635 RepID=A0A1H4MKU7_9MICO|nr:capsular exopolysaccharide family [Microbacterium humi]
MTFYDVLAALWRRKWTIIAVTLLAGICAVVYLQRQSPNFESSTLVRLNPTMTNALNSGVLQGISVDVDPAVITTPDVIDDAATALHMSSASLAASITPSILETTSPLTVSISITGTAADPRTAQRLVSVTTSAYTSYLEGIITNAVAELQSQLSDATEQAKEYQNQLSRNPGNQIAQTNLTTVLSRINTLNMSVADLQTAGPPASVTRPASFGSSTNPSAFNIAGVGILCGLIAGAGIALVRDRFDDRLRTIEEMERTTDITVLGFLPRDRAVARKRVLLPAAGGTSVGIREGIRSLRTTVQVLLPQGKGVVAITSVEPADGKTFVSANLAVSFARAGRKVILVAGDLRRPQLDVYFSDAMGGPGLGGLLTGSADQQLRQSEILDALQTTTHPGLRLLPPGAIAREPADALAGANLPRLIRTLADSADLVIVDTPPALTLADASVLASSADGTIVIATVDRTRRAHLADVVDTLKVNGATMFGVIANRSRKRAPKSYVSYYSSEHEVATDKPDTRVAHANSARAGKGAADNEADPSAPVMSVSTRPDRDSNVPPPGATLPDRVLFVCSANECRSPFAEEIAKREAAGLPVQFSSAGIRAASRSVSTTAREHARDLGIDLSGHRSKPVSPASLGEYDLILALSRENARSLLAESPDVAPRLFTLKQFARWISVHDRPADKALGAWLDEQDDTPRVAEFLGSNPEDDVNDPMGMPLKYWRLMSDELADSIDDVIRGLYHHEVAQPQT